MKMKFTVFTLFTVLQRSNCLTFEKNLNLTEELRTKAFSGNFSTQRSVLGCAKFCAYAGKNNTCNGFVFKKSESACSLLNLNMIDRLEDNHNNPKEEEFQIFTDLEMRSKLPLYCNGGVFDIIIMITEWRRRNLIY